MSGQSVATENMSVSDEQKVAILLASLKQSAAAAILQQLSPDVMARVADAMRRLGVVSSEVRQRVIADCLRGITDSRGAIRGDEQLANSLLVQAIGEKRAAALLQGEEEGASAFAHLAELGADQILSIIGREQPSVIAMVLRHLSYDLAAELLNMVPHEVGKRVMFILCTGKPPSEEAVARAGAYIESRLGQSRRTQRADSGDMIERASSILQAVDHSLAEGVLQSIDEHAPDLGAELRDRLFSFEDIVRLSDADMRRVMQEVDMGGLAVALRSAPVDVREKFFVNMSKRAAEGLREDMEYAPKMRLSDIEVKQKEIIAIVRELDGQGEISIQEGGQNEYV